MSGFSGEKPLKTFIIRKAPKAHGRQQQIEGLDILARGPVILVDDVATTGKAFLESLDVLDKMGVKAPKAICIIDREEGRVRPWPEGAVNFARYFQRKNF